MQLFDTMIHLVCITNMSDKRTENECEELTVYEHLQSLTMIVKK